MNGTWKTTGGGGSGAGQAALVIGAAVIAVAVIGPVVAAVVSLVKVLLTALAVTAVVVGALLVLAWRMRRTRRVCQRQVRVLAASRLSVLPAQQQDRPAIENHYHNHFHGMTADDVAEALARRQEQS